MTMTTATDSRHLQMSESRTEFTRWRLGFFVVLACFVLIALAAFAQPPTKALIRPTGPLPAVNVP
jgi:hypothetical protein